MLISIIDNGGTVTHQPPSPEEDRDALAAEMFPHLDAIKRGENIYVTDELLAGGPVGFPLHKVKPPTKMARVATAALSIVWALFDGLVSAWKSIIRDPATFCFCLFCLAGAAYWIYAIATSMTGH